MSSSAHKILVCGDVKGEYKQLLTRIIQVNRKSGPFEMVLCVGEFFDQNDQSYHDLIHGSLELPSVPIYILGTGDPKLVQYYKSKDPDTDYESGFELIDGITYLGRKGILTTSSGIRIAYLSGKENADDSSDDKTSFSLNDYESLLMAHQSSSDIIDILITNQWPKYVFRYTEGHNKEWELKTQEIGSTLVSKLCLLLTPRYHFVGGFNCFYERHPFRNHRVLAESARHVTRFIALADVANAAKDKWLYAFGLTPARDIDKSELIKQPMDVTENPFSELPDDRTTSTKTVNSSLDTSTQFFYDMSQPRVDGNQRNQRFDKRRRQNDESRGKRPRQQIDPQQCWFCLASPHVEKHLIISIGDHSYLAMAKGGLTDDHLLILPIDHMRATIEIEDQQLLDELERFKSALTQYFRSKHRSLVFFERNFKSSHLQIQVVPIPEAKSQNLKSAILDSTQERNLNLKELTDDLQLKDVLNAGIPYFYIEGSDFKLFTPIKTSEFFPLQLGREILAQPSVLDCLDRVDWKACALSDKEAIAVANKIRKEFEPFDFTLQ